jgi:hypothetical protein
LTRRERLDPPRVDMEFLEQAGQEFPAPRSCRD